MNYQLRFVHLSPSHRIAGVGMAGNLMIVVNELLMLKDDDTVWVNMCDYETIAGVNKNESLWSEFFNQFDMSDDSTTIDLINRPPNIDYKGRYQIDTPIMVKGKERFFKHFSLTDGMTTDINNFYDNNIKGKETLGCQIRLGDMVNNHRTSDIEEYLAKIKLILEENPNIEQIFLATDDDKAINILENNLDVKIIYQKEIYRTSSNDPYTRLYDDRTNHNIKLCKEVIMDIFILTKCDYFLRADTSSVSLMTTMFSEHIKKLYFV